MKISARVENQHNRHQVSLSTDGSTHSIDIPPKASGYGSSANGGELLFLALASCYVNDIYREADKRGIQVEAVEVEVEGEFGAPGEPAKNVCYHARVRARADEAAIRDLMQHTDTVAEIQNSLRASIPVSLERIEVEALA